MDRCSNYRDLINVLRKTYLTHITTTTYWPAMQLQRIVKQIRGSVDEHSKTTDMERLT